MNTKNVMFFETSIPLEWYHENIYAKLLNKLYEFTIEGGSVWNQCTLFYTLGNSTYIDLLYEILILNPMTNFVFACIYQNVRRNVNKLSSYEHFSKFMNLEGT